MWQFTCLTESPAWVPIKRSVLWGKFLHLTYSRNELNIFRIKCEFTSRFLPLMSLRSKQNSRT